MDTTKDITLKSALYYASRGWQVFPVKHHDKHPLIPWATGATSDEGTVRNYWERDWIGSNIGIATGARSGIIVLDIDPKHGGDESLLNLIAEHGQLPDTPESLTGGGGRHIIFNHPGVEIRNSVSELAPGLDIRGDGGFIVAPPSVHETGNLYEWEASSKPSRTPLADIPQWLLDMLLAIEARRNGGGAVRMPAPVIEGEISEGSRNQILASFAGSMRRRGMGIDAIFQALLSENKERCKPPLSNDEVMAIAKSIGRYEPTSPPEIMAAPEEIKAREPLDAFGAGSAFFDLMMNLEGRSIKTYIPNLDKSIGGIERQTLTVLAARPSMGKSTIAWQVARNVASNGQRALFFALEMSIASMWAKAACGAVGVRWRDIRNGEAPEADVTKVLDITSELMHKYADRLLIDDGVNTTFSIAEVVERYRPDLVVVDHIRLLKDPGDKEVKRLGVITERLKEIAKAYNCGMLALAQLNRGPEARDNKRPTLADLRDSGEIEENSDLILMMYRDDYYNGEQAPSAVALTEILVRKFRDDVLNQRVTLAFDAAHQWFNATRNINDYTD